MPLEILQLRIIQLKTWLDNNELTMDELIEIYNIGDTNEFNMQ